MNVVSKNFTNKVAVEIIVAFLANSVATITAAVDVILSLYRSTWIYFEISVNHVIFSGRIVMDTATSSAEVYVGSLASFEKDAMQNFHLPGGAQVGNIPFVNHVT